MDRYAPSARKGFPMRLRKRLLSLLLVLVLSFALLPAAEAKTGTLVSNTGTRHVVCTSLSSQALAYYTGNYTYDVVSGLAASSTSPMSSAMFSRLSTLMSSTMTNSVSYNSLTNYWPKTDNIWRTTKSFWVSLTMMIMWRVATVFATASIAMISLKAKLHRKKQYRSLKS